MNWNFLNYHIAVKGDRNTWHTGWPVLKVCRSREDALLWFKKLSRERPEALVLYNRDGILLGGD